MGEDPLERERHFRQMIEQSVEARRQARWPRRWLKPVAALFFKALLFFTRPWLALLVVLMCFGGFFAVIFGLAIKWTDAYDCSVGEARRSSVVVEELGEPVEAGFFAWCPGYSQELSVTNASFHTTLRGPKGQGTYIAGVVVQLARGVVTSHGVAEERADTLSVRRVDPVPLMPLSFVIKGDRHEPPRSRKYLAGTATEPVFISH